MNEYEIDINDYKRIKPIGQGAFGKVYLVENTKTNKEYAAKIIKTEYDLEEEEEEEIDKSLLLNEFITHKSMNNPAILKIIGYCYNDFSMRNHLTMILEYMPNSSLDKVLKNLRKGITPKGWTTTKSYINLLGIAIGMKYLHLQKTVQRDLKPGNILLDINYYPKISDFGFSKKLDELNSKKVITTKRIGTPIYMAPELLRCQNYTYKVDIYAYSILAYELITTKFPYSSNDFKIYQVPNGKRPDTSIIKDQIVVNFLKKCWSDDPNERPTFSEIVEILEDKRFYSKFDVDLEEIKNYLKLFENEKLSEDVPASNEPTALNKIISLTPDANDQSTLEAETTQDANTSKVQDANTSEPKDDNTSEPKDDNTSEPKDANTSEPKDDNTSKTLHACSSTILDIETKKMIENLVDMVFKRPIITGKILKDMKVNPQDELLITPETMANPIQMKPYADFIPTVTIYLDRYLKEVDYDKLQNLLSEEAVILKVKSYLKNSEGDGYHSKLQIALLSIDNFGSNIESSITKYITGLQKRIEENQPVICKIVGEPKIRIPDDDDIKSVYCRSSINPSHDSDDLFGIDMNQIRKVVLQRLRKDKSMYNWKFYFSHDEIYEQMNSKIKENLEINSNEMYKVSQTYLTNNFIDDYIKFKNQLIKSIPLNHISERFLYNGSIVKTKDGNIGEGFYATENPFFAALKSNEEKMFEVNQKAQIICYIAIYNNNKVDEITDDSFKGEPIKDNTKNYYGINHAFVGDSEGFMPIRPKEKERNSIIAEEFVFSNNIQIIPLCLFTVMRKDHFILWKDDKFIQFNSIKIKNKDVKFMLKLSKKMEVNVYYKQNVDEALTVIKNKKSLPFKLITNGGDGLSGKELITKAREFTRTKFVCLVYAKSFDHMEWISKMTNVLFTINSDYFMEFAELNLNKNDVIDFDKKLREDKNFAQMLKVLNYKCWETNEKELLNFGEKNYKVSFFESIHKFFHKK